MTANNIYSRERPAVEKIIRSEYLAPAPILIFLVSVLAPLSWFVIFKAHSYLHAHLNFIVWQLPFAILGFAMCGAILQSVRPGDQK